MDKKLIGLITVFLLVFGVFMAYMVFNQQENVAIRASNQDPVSCSNSFIFIGQTSSVVGSTVPVITYIRDDESVGLTKIPTTCTTNLGIINPSEAITSNTGSASFTISSTTAGIATITCSTPSCDILAKTVSIKFK